MVASLKNFNTECKKIAAEEKVLKYKHIEKFSNEIAIYHLDCLLHNTKFVIYYLKIDTFLSMLQFISMPFTIQKGSLYIHVYTSLFK